MWLEEAYFPNIGSKSVFLIDLWTGHCPNIISDLTLQENILLLLYRKALQEKYNH